MTPGDSERPTLGKTSLSLSVVKAKSLTKVGLLWARSVYDLFTSLKSTHKVINTDKELADIEQGKWTPRALS